MSTSLIAGFGFGAPFAVLASIELVVALWATFSLRSVAGVRA
jgi:hypothetical protein